MATTTTPLPTTRAYAEPSSTSARLFQQAQAVMPGGNSRTSVFMAPYPPYAAEGQGCWVVDVDGDRRLRPMDVEELGIEDLLVEQGVGHRDKERIDRPDGEVTRDQAERVDADYGRDEQVCAHLQIADGARGGYGKREAGSFRWRRGFT
jgi:hypothetical protein